MNQLRTRLALIVVLLTLIACGSSSQAAVITQRWYGKTKSGRFMTQRDAQSKGYRPAYGAVCG